MEKDWFEILKNEFNHPAIVLWRATELRHIDKISSKQDYFKEPILDLGCADGKIADILFKGKILFGIDNCWQLLSQNQRRQIYKALVLADGCRMPYKNEMFGSVFSNCVIEHIPDISSVLGEISRILKPKGILLFTVPSHKFVDLLFFSIIFEKLGLSSFAKWYKIKRNKLLNHFHCYDHNYWSDILKHKGLNLIKYEYYMSKEATFVWDLIAALFFILRPIKILNYLFQIIYKQTTNYLKKYYNINSEIGSGLLLVAQKGV